MSGPLPAVAKGVRVDFHMAMGDDPNMQTREFFQYTGSLSTGDAVTWLGEITAAWNTFVAATLNGNLNSVFVELTDLSSPTAPQVTNSTGATGGDVSASLSNGTAFVVKKHIARRYRGGHPRLYLPGMSAGHLLNPAQWTNAYATTLIANYNTFLGVCVGGTIPAAIGSVNHVNISYFQGFTNHLYPSGRVKAIPTPRVTPLVDLITGISANLIPASQRRRNEQP